MRRRTLSGHSLSSGGEGIGGPFFAWAGVTEEDCIDLSLQKRIDKLAVLVPATVVRENYNGGAVASSTGGDRWEDLSGTETVIGGMIECSKRV